MNFYVYILRCGDGSYYTGHTDDIEHRMSQHFNGEPGYTSSRKPLELVYSAGVPSREEAIEMEFRIKKWSRAKKEALIAGNWPEISRLAKKQFK